MIDAQRWLILLLISLNIVLSRSTIIVPERKSPIAPAVICLSSGWDQIRVESGAPRATVVRRALVFLCRVYSGGYYSQNLLIFRVEDSTALETQHNKYFVGSYDLLHSYVYPHNSMFMPELTGLRSSLGYMSRLECTSWYNRGLTEIQRWLHNYILEHTSHVFYCCKTWRRRGLIRIWFGINEACPPRPARDSHRGLLPPH